MKTDQLSALVMSASCSIAPRTVDAEILYEADIPAVVASVDASTNAGQANEFAAIFRAHRHELAN